jgi:hypothetical protein
VGCSFGGFVMAKDPAFLFYPGDYLRDTQTLSEKSQVAYDRIMCEHMRNICISKQQLKFFTKRLSDEELEEIMFVLTEINGGYQIEWVAESIIKRKAYSESRRKNRLKNNEKDMNNISGTYDKHMENENENENISKTKSKKFIIPTIEQIKEYCQERNNNINPDKFHDFYTAKGWMLGKNKMKDWKAAIRTWEKPDDKKTDLYKKEGSDF